MEKMNEKKNDVKCMKMEIENLKKRVESNKKDTAAVAKSFSNKKSASDVSLLMISRNMKNKILERGQTLLYVGTFTKLTCK